MTEALPQAPAVTQAPAARPRKANAHGVRRRKPCRPSPEALPPRAVDARAAAALCGVSRSHFLALYGADKVGPVPFNLGRRVLWRVADLDAWLEAGCPPRDRWETMKGRRP